MKGYKVFNPDWTCRQFQYKVGESYEMECKPIICEQGFHFCTDIKDCFRFYDFNPKNRVAKIEAYGDVVNNIDYTKYATNKICILKEISWDELPEMLEYSKVNIEVSGISLISIDEYEKCKEFVPNIGRWWWLRSPGNSGSSAACVYYDGAVFPHGCHVSVSGGAVRPALFCNPKSSNLQIKDKFWYKDYGWTVISNNMALCDMAVGNTMFNIDWESFHANVYERSDIKIWLKIWGKENGII